MENEMLTTKERLDTIERLKAYPAGVAATCWGFGPLTDVDWGQEQLYREHGSEYG